MIKILNLDPRSSVPIYQQIINGVKELVIRKILQPGDKLPSVREMAGMLTTNPNTVSKAYNELERLKIIETLRGRGTFVALDYKGRVMEENVLKLKDDLKNIVISAYSMGLNKEDLILMLSELDSNLIKNNNNGGKQ